MKKTFKELGFKPGDRVRCVESNELGLYNVGEEYVLEYYGPTNEPVISGLHCGYSGTWALVTDPPAFDPSTNRVPFGLLEEWEQEALMEAAEVKGAVVEYWAPSARKWLEQNTDSSPMHIAHALAYRVTPSTRVSVSNLTGTVAMKDGKPDWGTYEG